MLDVDTLNPASLTTKRNPYTCHPPRGRIALHRAAQLNTGVSEDNPVFAKTPLRSPKGARGTWRRGVYLSCSQEAKVAGETSGHPDRHGALGRHHERHSRGGEAIFKLPPSARFTGQGQDAPADGRGTGASAPRGPLRPESSALSSAKERLNALLLGGQD